MDNIDQALEAAAMLDRLPLPGGDGIVIFSTSGGATALTTDLADRIGLTCNSLQPSTNERLQNIYASPRLALPQAGGFVFAFVFMLFYS